MGRYECKSIVLKYQQICFKKGCLCALLHTYFDGKNIIFFTLTLHSYMNLMVI